MMKEAHVFECFHNVEIQVFINIFMSRMLGRMGTNTKELKSPGIKH